MTEDRRASSQSSENDKIDSEDLTELLGTPNASQLAPPRREFEPWHRPRKQYVRRELWLRELRWVIAKRKPSDGLLKYFSLPGNDLLDIRYLHDRLCVSEDLSLRFFGLNEAAAPGSLHESALSSALFTVKRLDRVDHRSRVIPDTLSDVAVPLSTARRAVEDIGGFHAINIDLCDGIGRGGEGSRTSDVFEALRVLLKGQSRSTDRAVFFITTRIDEPNVHGDVRALLESVIDETIKECEAVRRELAGQWSDLRDITSGQQLEVLGPRDTFLFGFVQWLVTTAHFQQIRARLSDVLTYRIASDDTDDDLVSLAIRLTPIKQIPPDPYGLASSRDQLPPEGYRCDDAATVPRPIKIRRSVDAILRSDPSLQAVLVEESITLLEAVGFTRAAYKAWLEDSRGGGT